MVIAGESKIGKGLFTQEDFLKGEYITEVTGETVTELDPEYNNYIDFREDAALDPHTPYCYINHCCDPNSEFVVECEEGKEEETKLFLKALKNIKKGDELCTDYGWHPNDAIPCECGSNNCRGKIIGEIYLCFSET